METRDRARHVRRRRRRGVYVPPVLLLILVVAVAAAAALLIRGLAGHGDGQAPDGGGQSQGDAGGEGTPDHIDAGGTVSDPEGGSQVPGGADGGDAPDAGDGGAENIVPADAGEYTQPLTELLAKNPEAVDFIRNFRGPAPYPESVDLSAELAQEGIPLLMQWDPRWGYCQYGTGLIGYTGCGPTCLSMVLVGLKRDAAYHPAYVAQFATDNGYCVPGDGTSWALFSEGAEKLGLTVKELPLWESNMAKELDAGHPIICIMGKGDFTDGGHYIVLTDHQDEGFTVLDPNRRDNCRVWAYEDLEGQIRNLWAYS